MEARKIKSKIICILIMTLLIVIPVLPASGTIDIIIMQINDPPIAYDDYYIVDEDTTLIKEVPGSNIFCRIVLRIAPLSVL